MEPLQTSSPPLPVLSYEPPRTTQLDSQRTLWWIFCGGFVYGVIATASGIVSIVSVYLAPAIAIHIPGGVFGSIVRCVYPACHIVLAIICFRAMRNKRSARTIINAMLFMISVQIAAFVANQFIYSSQFSDPGTKYWILARVILALPIGLVWPALLIWIVLPSTPMDGFAFRRRLYCTVAIIEILRALATMMELSYRVRTLPLTAGPGLWNLISIFADSFAGTCFIIAAIRCTGVRVLLMAGLIAFVVGFFASFVALWNPILGTAFYSPKLSYIPVVIGNWLLSSCAGGVIFVLPLIVSRRQTRGEMLSTN